MIRPEYLMNLRRLDDFFLELQSLQSRQEGASDLLQYRALASAHQYRLFFSTLAHFANPGDSILDWGCGNGHASWILTRLGFGPVTAFGFQHPRLFQILPDTAPRFVPGSSSEPVALPFEDGIFDVVVSVGVLEHVRETGGTERGSLSEIHRVLRPGGRFICAHFPNRGSWIEAIARRVPGMHHHRHLYRQTDIRELTAEAGLELEELREYGFLPRNLWSRGPRAVRSSRRFASSVDALDRMLERAFPGALQNHLWVSVRS